METPSKLPGVAGKVFTLKKLGTQRPFPEGSDHSTVSFITLGGSGVGLVEVQEWVTKRGVEKWTYDVWPDEQAEIRWRVRVKQGFTLDTVEDLDDDCSSLTNVV